MDQHTVTEPEWLNADEVVARFRLPSRAALYTLRTRGRGPRGHRFGRQLLFKLEDLEAWEKARADGERTNAR